MRRNVLSVVTAVKNLFPLPFYNPYSHPKTCIPDSDPHIPFRHNFNTSFVPPPLLPDLYSLPMKCIFIATTK